MNSKFATKDYSYELPDERIAKYPLPSREASKLLHYSQGVISHLAFKDVTKLLSKDTTLFLNNTKVIAARLFFKKDTGAKIEIFLTAPLLPHPEFQKALKARNNCTWKCLIGNVKKWKEGQTLSLTLNDTLVLQANLVDRENSHVAFSWHSTHTFLDIVEAMGCVPLPPYLNRAEEKSDKERYQTIFSALEGAVAAPTAGLHFTEGILSQFTKKGIIADEVTLHVSAGTFRPIKADDFTVHDMHNEQIIISKKNIENILYAKGRKVAVGTTAMRTLESAYWFGVKLVKNETTIFKIEQSDAYKKELQGVSLAQSMTAILKKMDADNVSTLRGETEIFIYPSYTFRVVDGLFTNFHQPSSTLILLVAAFVGKDWKRIYQEALSGDYRFLSYGDTSLLWKNDKLIPFGTK